MSRMVIQKEEWDELKHSHIQYKNMETIHNEYVEEQKKETNRLNDRIKKLENILESERQSHKEEIERLTQNINLMGGEDLTGTNLSREQKYYQKSRYILSEIKKTQTTVKNKGYKNTIISIHSQIRDFTKGKRKTWISTKQEAVIDNYLASNPAHKNDRVWVNGKKYEKKNITKRLKKLKNKKVKQK